MNLENWSNLSELRKTAYDSPVVSNNSMSRIPIEVAINCDGNVVYKKKDHPIQSEADKTVMTSKGLFSFGTFDDFGMITTPNGKSILFESIFDVFELEDKIYAIDRRGCVKYFDNDFDLHLLLAPIKGFGDGPVVLHPPIAIYVTDETAYLLLEKYEGITGTNYLFKLNSSGAELLKCFEYHISDVTNMIVKDNLLVIGRAGRVSVINLDTWNHEIRTIAPEDAEPRIFDVHMHVIPAVDDGAESIDMAMDMLRTAYFQGVREVICTSHGAVFLEENERRKAKQNYIELVGRCRVDFPDMNLHLGAELLVVGEHQDKLIKRLDEKTMPTLADSKYILTEFYNGHEFEEMLIYLDKFLNAGYIPIIAHIEKYQDIFSDIMQVQQIKEMGCLIQINCSSIGDISDIQTDLFVNELLHNRLVDFVGSDAHKSDYRPPLYVEGVTELYKYNKYDREYIDAILYKNAQELLLETDVDKKQYDLSRFRNAHAKDFETAISEIRAGHKESHWMWYMFPQIVGLGMTSTSQYYAIENLDEAKAYYEDDILGDHMDELCDVLLNLDCSDALTIFGHPDNLKLKSSMTLFYLALPEENRFIQVLNKFYDGALDEKTVEIANKLDK